MKNEGTSRIILATLGSAATVAVVAGTMGLGAPAHYEIGAVEARTESQSDEARPLQVQVESAGVVTWLSVRPKVTLEDWTFGTEPNEPEITNIPEKDKGQVTIEYKPADASDEEYTEEVPSEAGAYVVRVRVAASYPYASGRASAEFNILQATPALGEVTVTMPPNSLDPADAEFTRGMVGVLGDFELLADKLSWGENECTWVFTPEDARNFQSLSENVTVTAWQDGWVELPDGSRMYYRDAQPVIGVTDIGEHRYYFDADGIMVHDRWATIDGQKFYLDADGIMVGEGWLQLDNGDWMHFEDYQASVGWDTIGGRKFYFDADGVMATLWRSINGEWYFFGHSGAMKNGWLRNGGGWYWLGSPDDGRMVTGWNKIDGTWYFFRTSGAAMGALLRGGFTPDGYRVNADGAWIA